MNKFFISGWWFTKDAKTTSVSVQEKTTSYSQENPTQNYGASTPPSARDCDEIPCFHFTNDESEIIKLRNDSR